MSPVHLVVVKYYSSFFWHKITRWWLVLTRVYDVELVCQNHQFWCESPLNAYMAVAQTVNIVYYTYM